MHGGGRWCEYSRFNRSSVQNSRRRRRVYAIESHSDYFNVLCANLALNSIRNTKPICAFVATDEQAYTSSTTWGKFAYVSQTWGPQFMALDALDLAACDLIKVDVDGRELDVLQSGEMQIVRHRPVLYFENDVREASPELLSYAAEKLGDDLYWHPAPIFDQDNFFGNPINRRITDKNDWWK